MIVHRCAQGSKEWLKLRSGRPTSSNFERIVTPTGKLSTAREGYMRELTVELIMGRPTEGPTMPWMTRGSFLEAEARESYCFAKDAQVEQVGFCTTDDGAYGASTDGLVGEDGVLELKCPKPENHLLYLLWSQHQDKYKSQTMGELLVTERDWLDIVSYCPEFPPEAQLAIVRVERDEKYIALLADQLKLFCDELNLVKDMLRDRGWLHQDAPPPKEFLTEADVDLIVAAKRARGDFNAEAR